MTTRWDRVLAKAYRDLGVTPDVPTVERTERAAEDRMEHRLSAYACTTDGCEIAMGNPSDVRYSATQIEVVFTIKWASAPATVENVKLVVGDHGLMTKPIHGALLFDGDTLTFTWTIDGYEGMSLFTAVGAMAAREGLTLPVRS